MAPESCYLRDGSHHHYWLLALCPHNPETCAVNATIVTGRGEPVAMNNVEADLGTAYAPLRVHGVFVVGAAHSLQSGVNGLLRHWDHCAILVGKRGHEPANLLQCFGVDR